MLQHVLLCCSTLCCVAARCAVLQQGVPSVLQRPRVQAEAQIEYMTAGHVRAGYHEVIRASVVLSGALLKYGDAIDVPAHDIVAERQ